MDDSGRDDKALQHFMARAQRPTQHPVQRQPVQVFVVYDSAGMKEGLTHGKRWTHVGTSPKLSPVDQMQARRRIQTYMADR